MDRLYREWLHKFFKPVSCEQVAAEKRLAEKEKQRIKLFSGFARRNKQHADICSALEAGGIKLAHRFAHTLRGFAGMMKKKELQKAARVIESTLAEGDSDALNKDTLEKMGRELEKVLSELSEFIEPTKAGEPADLDKNAARELFDHMEPLLKADSAECRMFTDALRNIL